MNLPNGSSIWLLFTAMPILVLSQHKRACVNPSITTGEKKTTRERSRESMEMSRKAMGKAAPDDRVGPTTGARRSTGEGKATAKQTKAR